MVLSLPTRKGDQQQHIDTMTAENAATDLLPWIVAGITGIGVVVSFITFWFQRERSHETSKAEKQRVLLARLAEAFRLLYDVRHRVARKVVYGNPDPSSFEIIGLNRPTVEGNYSYDELTRICKEIVKNDCNEIGVLAHHGLVDGDKFIEEGFWVILKVWDLLKDDIVERRKRDSLMKLYIPKSAQRSQMNVLMPLRDSHLTMVFRFLHMVFKTFIWTRVFKNTVW